VNSRRLSQNIETDSYDRDLFRELEAGSKELKDLVERGSNLLPEFRRLVFDLFASFFKLNVILIPQEEVSGGSILARRVIELALSSEGFKRLREDTALDGFKSALACLKLGEDLMMWIKSDQGISKNTLIKEWEIERAEENYIELKQQLETWENLGKRENITKLNEESFISAKKNANQKLKFDQEEFGDLLQNQMERIDKIDLEMKKQIRSSLHQSMDMLDETEQDTGSWDFSIGVSKNRTIGEKIDLAYKLSKSEKLKKLTQLVGRLKEEMLNSRRKIWSKRGSEVFDVSLGGGFRTFNSIRTFDPDA